MPYIHWETQERQDDLEAFLFCRSLLDSKPSNWQDLVSEFLRKPANCPQHQEAKTETMQRLEELYDSLHSILGNTARRYSERAKTELRDPLDELKQTAESFVKATDWNK